MAYSKEHLKSVTWRKLLTICDFAKKKQDWDLHQAVIDEMCYRHYSKLWSKIFTK